MGSAGHMVCNSTCNKIALNQAQNKLPLNAQISDFFGKMFDTKDWPARWHCGNWTNFHGWLYIFSDGLIMISYFAIPVLLGVMLKRRPDIPFLKVGWLFGAFIVLCGCTHLIDMLIFWWPAYRLSAIIRLLTGIVSAVTLLALYRVMPVIMSLRNVSELEREIKQREEAETALNKSHQLLIDSHQQLRSFTHILSHNIRNHASNIALLTDMVDKATLEESNAELFEKIARVSHGLNNTLNDLAEAIMIRERQVEPVLVNFQEILDEVLDILQSDLEVSKVTIATDFTVSTIVYPKIYLESILMNLVSNAIKYKRENVSPSISLSTHTDECGCIIMQCKDNGIGINLELHGGKIFGLYKTFHTHKDAHGVGLFLVKTQIESQRGTITVDSKVGEGTCFKINFNQNVK
jgi:chemotaxis family two-component system sensor kinase Cph1